MVLRAEVAFALDGEDEVRYHAYLAAGMPEATAARQVAQDILGSTGAFVQRAEADES
jgi:hypothetical protein